MTTRLIEFLILTFPPRFLEGAGGVEKTQEVNGGEEEEEDMMDLL